MDFEWSQEAREREQAIRDLSPWRDERWRAKLEHPDHRAEALQALIREIDAAGALRPEAEGGAEDARIATWRELGLQDPSALLSVSVSHLLIELIQAWTARAGDDGTGDLDELCHGLATGGLLGAVALLDEGAPTVFTRDAEGLCVRGAKRFVPNGPLADVVGVFGELDGRPALGVVSAYARGLVRDDPLPLVGGAGLSVSALRFEEVRLPADRLLGSDEAPDLKARAGQGLELCVAQAAVAVTRRAWQAGHGYARDHRQPGSERSLMKRQSVAFRIAEGLTLAQTADLMVTRAAWRSRQADAESLLLARAARVFAVDAAGRVAGDLSFVMGGAAAEAGGAADAARQDATRLAATGRELGDARMDIADTLLRRHGGGEA